MFNYFPDKSSLLIAALLDDLVKVQKDAMVSFSSDVTVCEKFLYISKSFYQYYAKNPDLSRTLIKEMRFVKWEWGDALKEQADQYVLLISRIIDDGKKRGEIKEEVNSDIAAASFFSHYYSVLLLGLNGEEFKPDDLIENLGVKRVDLLQAILDVGVSTGELSCKSGVFKLKGKVSKSLITEKGDALGALIQANVTYYNSAYREFGNRLRGGELSDDLEKIGDLVARVSKIQEPLIENFIYETIKGKRSMNLLEIGCGSGSFMKTAYTANNNTIGLGIDCDGSVVEQARNNMEKWGLSDRFKIVHGDIRTCNLKDDGPFDLITIYNLIYYFEPEERGDLINRLKANLSPGGKIGLITTTRSHGNDPAAANLNLVNYSLKGVTAVPELESLERLFIDCGFKTVEKRQVLPRSSFYSLLAS